MAGKVGTEAGMSEREQGPGLPGLGGAEESGFCLVLVFPVVMYGCESWTVKKAER